ncbi:hypothetical protein CK203_065930 [Vitis vinifera]|uniref:Uncharacterized protein n=1 Tax=Vitis vinifera TaxID=29760 RepID=A0A438FP25_VITVI|nr:hypothetical protein CK203_065930 [Vitis vinifera]
MRRFAEVVDELGLVDLQLQGGAFTWSGGLNSLSRARLDRFLSLPAGLISLVGFENMWFKVEGFKDLIRNWWRGIEGGVRNLECNKEAALHQVEYWDRVEDERSLTMEELACKKEAKEGYAKWVDLEETHWRQVSRELWLKAGDRTRDISTQQFRKFGVEGDIGSLPFNQICLQEAETLELPSLRVRSRRPDGNEWG